MRRIGGAQGSSSSSPLPLLLQQPGMTTTGMQQRRQRDTLPVLLLPQRRPPRQGERISPLLLPFPGLRSQPPPPTLLAPHQSPQCLRLRL